MDKSAEKFIVSRIGTEMWRLLKPVQKYALVQLRKNGGSGLLTLDMGAGKTLVALMNMLVFGAQAFPVLIIAPASMTHSWKRSLKRWLKIRTEDEKPKKNKPPKKRKLPTKKPGSRKRSRRDAATPVALEPLRPQGGQAAAGGQAEHAVTDRLVKHAAGDGQAEPTVTDRLVKHAATEGQAEHAVADRLVNLAATDGLVNIANLDEEDGLMREDKVGKSRSNLSGKKKKKKSRKEVGGMYGAAKEATAAGDGSELAGGAKLEAKDNEEHPPKKLKKAQVQILKTGKERPRAGVMVVITTFDRAKHLVTRPWGNASQFKMVVVDESHWLKNLSCERTRLLVPALSRFDKRLLLSASPGSNPRHWYPQLSTVAPSKFGYWSPSCQGGWVRYRERYCAPTMQPSGWDPVKRERIMRPVYNGLSNLKELLAELDGIRFRDLPGGFKEEFSYSRVRLLFGQKQAARRGKVSLFDWTDGAEKPSGEPELLGARSRGKESEDLMASWQWLCSQRNDLKFMQRYHDLGRRRVAAFSKYFRKHLRPLWSPGGKLPKMIFFAEHRDCLERLHAMVADSFPDDPPEMLRRRVVLMTGQTKEKDRARLVQQFQTDKECLAIVLSIRAFAEGITLTAATWVIIVQTTFDGNVPMQAERRAIRIGQREHVTILYVQLAGEKLEKSIWDAILKKIRVDGLLLGCERHAQFGAKVEFVELE